MRKTAATLVATALFISSAGAAGQGTALQDRGTLQAIGLFEQSCLRFAGSADNLRSWIASKNLPEVTSDQSTPFLGGYPGKVYGASTKDGKQVLVSQDNGNCKVIMEAGDKSHVDKALQNEFRRLGASVSNVHVKNSPDGQKNQTLLSVVIGSRKWLVSTTSKTHKEAPSMLSELTILATVPNEP